MILSNLYPGFIQTIFLNTAPVLTFGNRRVEQPGSALLVGTSWRGFKPSFSVKFSAGFCTGGCRVKTHYPVFKPTKGKCISSFKFF
jgi:hypothetical protein